MNLTTVEKMISAHGNRKNALKHFLTLKPYRLDGLGLIFSNSGVDLEENLIRYKYATFIGNRFFIGDIPKEFYNRHSKILKDYYDLSAWITIKQNSHVESKHNFGGYVITKRSTINKLIENIDIINMLEKEIAPSMLRTLWYEEIKAEKSNKDIISMPKDFISADVGYMKHEVILKILLQEQGQKTYDTMEDLRRDIDFDYDKFIDNQSEVCMQCKYQKGCLDDGECKYFEELSKEEQDNWLALPEYEPLSIEKLLYEIKTLFLDGILYLDEYIIGN